MSSLLRLLARQYAAWTTTWLFILGTLVVVTLPSYASTYPNDAARQAAVALAQNDAATTMLYGRLPDPGSPGQMFVWEIGAFVTLTTGVLAVSLAVRLSRAAEQEGTLEVLRTAGLLRLTPLRATLLVLTAVGVLLGGVSAAATGSRTGVIDGVDWSGALAFGSVVALTFVLIALITVVLAQFLPTARSARVAGALTLVVSFVLRAVGDSQRHSWPNWVSPLGLRATVEPFTSDSRSPLLAGAVAALLLGLVALLLERPRELAGSILRAPTTRVRRLRVSSPLGLAWRLDRATTTWWVAGITLGGALFTTMGSGVVETARQGQLSGGFLQAHLAGADPASAYVSYTATIVAILVTAFAILTTLKAAAQERTGAGEYLVTTGSSPSRVLAGQLGVALIGATLALGATAVLIAIVAPLTVGGPEAGSDAFRQVIDQWSGVLVLMGPTVLMAGLWPRLAWLGWTPYAASIVLAMLGSLLGLPQTLIDLGPFDHPHGVLTPMIRLTLFTITVGVGLRAIDRRDLKLG